MNIAEKIAELSKSLGVYISYEYSLRISAPGEVYCGKNETFLVRADGYRTLYLPIFEQVLSLTVDDFIKIDS
jgi:hypothetical protein